MKPFLVPYDGQCEVCQAGISWLRALDRRSRTSPVPVEEAALPPGLTLEECLRELHVVGPDNRVWRGWSAVARLARLFPWTWLVGAIGAVPPFSWIAHFLYRWVARNRYSLSRCRGGACRSSRPETTRAKASFISFWSCRLFGFLMRFPLMIFAWMRRMTHQVRDYWRVRGRRFDLLDDRLSMCFLSGWRCDLVPLLFGEQFVMHVYDGVAIDPGSLVMRRSLKRHLAAMQLPIHAVTATHHHEEHVGNLRWLAQHLEVPLYLTRDTFDIVSKPIRLPFARRLIIGATEPVPKDVIIIDDEVRTRDGVLQVIPTSGHCDDHVSFYDPERRVLLAGDAFMGSYFVTPNPDVNANQWVETLRRLIDMPIDILVEGHGHIHTLRDDIDVDNALVIRQAPRDVLAAKLEFFEWIRDQLAAGRDEGLSPRMIEATCFPWGQRWNWEQYLGDTLIRAMSLGHFSRREVVRSFTRSADASEMLPTLYSMTIHGE